MAQSPDLVTVSEPRSEPELALVQTVLADAGIEFVVKSAQVQNLLGVGQIGGYNLVTGPVQVQVLAGDAGRARNALDEALAGTEGHGEENSPCPACGESASGLPTCPNCGLALEPDRPDSTRPNASPPAPDPAASAATRAMVWAVLWLGGIGSILAIHFGFKALRIARASGTASRHSWKAYLGIALGAAGLLLWAGAWRQLLRLVS